MQRLQYRNACNIEISQKQSTWMYIYGNDYFKGKATIDNDAAVSHLGLISIFISSNDRIRAGNERISAANTIARMKSRLK